MVVPPRHLGINPEVMGIVMGALGYTVHLDYLSTKGLDSRIADSNSGVAILCYKHSSGAHYITIQYNNGQYYAYNLNNPYGPDNLGGLH